MRGSQIFIYRNVTSKLKHLQLQCFCTTLRGWRHFGIAIVKRVHIVGAQVTRLYVQTFLNISIQKCFHPLNVVHKHFICGILTCSSHFCKQFSSCLSFYGRLYNQISSWNIPPSTQTSIGFKILVLLTKNSYVWNQFFSLVCVQDGMLNFFGGKN